MFELWKVHINIVLDDEIETIMGIYNTYDDAIHKFMQIANINEDIGLSSCYIEKIDNITKIEYSNYDYFLIKEKI